jgi:hypothetical protein
LESLEAYSDVVVLQFSVEQKCSASAQNLWCQDNAAGPHTVTKSANNSLKGCSPHRRTTQSKRFGVLRDLTTLTGDAKKAQVFAA